MQTADGVGGVRDWSATDLKRSPAPPYFLMQISPSLSNIIARRTTARLLVVAEIERRLNVKMIKMFLSRTDAHMDGWTDGVCEWQRGETH